MNIDRLQKLKYRLTTEKDLSKIWLYYMDHFADHAEFTDLGEPVHNTYLQAVIQEICQQLFGKNIKTTDLLLIHLSSHQFTHGPIQIQGRIGGMIYFEDLKTGLLAISATPGSDLIKYSRFSVPNLPGLG
jgi:hypothetical protein